jgi:hypothetical protein
MQIQLGDKVRKNKKRKQQNWRKTLYQFSISKINPHLKENIKNI